MAASTPPPRNVGFLIQSSSHRSASSPLVGTPASKKQRQSQLKTIVQTFGDLMMNWQECIQVLDNCFSSIIDLISTMRSIENTCRKNKEWINKVMGESPLFPSFAKHRHYPEALECDVNQSMYLSSLDPNDIHGPGHETVNFMDLESKLNGKYLVDVETMRCQIKSLMRRLSDIVLAMRLKSEEANNFIVGQPIDTFEDDAIFHTDHIIAIMTLCQMYQLEYDRKYMMVDSIFNYNERETPITSNQYFNLLENIAIDWNDESKNSLIDSDQVEAFMIRNNIGPGNEW